MAKYVNRRTGAAIESDAAVKGGGWEASPMPAGLDGDAPKGEGGGPARAAKRKRKAVKDG